ncbi:hypothetical protein [Streptomyces prunicolor]|uniref:hypothetical protein n=1 Tax=Streptomyces prunicolor TaxID=67348 RepID=UPI00036F5193|nr:hypothetical protein [Streptomyces prunicolor]
MMVPKSFRMQDWLARAFHDAAIEQGLQDGELLRRLVTKHLEDRGCKLSDYMFNINGARH